jgi:hypothetical protein
MPCDEQQATFRREILVINNVDFSEPNVGQKPVESADNAVR